MLSAAVIVILVGIVAALAVALKNAWKEADLLQSVWVEVDADRQREIADRKREFEEQVSRIAVMERQHAEELSESQAETARLAANYTNAVKIVREVRQAVTGAAVAHTGGYPHHVPALVEGDL